MAGGGFRMDTGPFMAYLKNLSTKANSPLGDTIEVEVVKVLQSAAKKTGRTTIDRAGGKFNPQSKFFKGWVRMNGKFYYVGKTQGGKKGFRYSPSMWARLLKRLAALRKRAETRVALSKAAYYGVGAFLKLRRFSTGWGRDEGKLKEAYSKSGGLGVAASRGPKWSKTYTGKKNLRGNHPSISFTISSTNTFNPFTKGAGAVQKAMNGRMRYYEEAVGSRWHSVAKAIAAAYPHLKIGPLK